MLSGRLERPLDLALARYPYLRAGWPGPIGQSGSWSNKRDPIPWRPTYRNACPEGLDRHLHGVQLDMSGKFRSICLVFGRGRHGGKWVMLDDDPLPGPSNVLTAPAGLNLGFPAGVVVMPGWPVSSVPEPCGVCTPVEPPQNTEAE